MAFALLLAAARGIVPGDGFVPRGPLGPSSFPLLPRIHSRRLGILGLGRIGRAILARRAEGVDMPVAYHNRKPRRRRALPPRAAPARPRDLGR
jgi:lactate dehydrogenase-like 2-hydroxyacid dehydrogenase